MTPKSGETLVKGPSRWVCSNICAGHAREEPMSSQNLNFTPTEMRAKNVEPKNPTALLVTGPAEQQSPLKNLVKLLLRILPDGFAVTWWGWCPQRTLKEIENEKNRTKAMAVKNALV